MKIKKVVKISLPSLIAITIIVLNVVVPFKSTCACLTDMHWFTSWMDSNENLINSKIVETKFKEWYPIGKKFDISTLPHLEAHPETIISLNFLNITIIDYWLEFKPFASRGYRVFILLDENHKVVDVKARRTVSWFGIETLEEDTVKKKNF